ncbi:hypothetical protein ACLB1S_20615 [Escherichia coli]
MKALHERINKYRNAPQDDSGSNLYWIRKVRALASGIFNGLTPVYLADWLQQFWVSINTIRME